MVYLFAALLVFAAVAWLVVADQLKKRGKGAVVAHLAGVVTGVIAFAAGAIVLAVVAPRLDRTAAVVTGLDGIHQQVIDDTIKQYETAKATGDPVTVCTYAGMVVAAYIQAHDEAKAKEWKTTERGACAKAGVAIP